MRSPFLRFTVAFVVIVVCAGAAWFYYTRRAPAAVTTVDKPSPAGPVQPLTPPVSHSTEPSPGTKPHMADNPPDLNGLNYPEVAIPGSDIPSPAPPGQQTTAGSGYVAELTARKLVMPIAGVPAQQLSDTFNDQRGASKHEATDIMAARGTPVRAIDEGNIVKLFLSKRGGNTIYQFDDSRKYCYYYAHLDKYAPGIKEGSLVRAGDVIGYVGSTGDADANAPHLHFAISLLNPDQHYWQGTPLDPYPVLVKIAGSAAK